MNPIQIGGGGTFGDPSFDKEEENQEVREIRAALRVLDIGYRVV
jgi:hypothetical protein